MREYTVERILNGVWRGRYSVREVVMRTDRLSEAMACLADGDLQIVRCGYGVVACRVHGETWEYVR